MSTRAKGRKAGRPRRRQWVEELEPRMLLSVSIPPDPIKPNLVERLLLQQANSPGIRNNPTLLDNWPVPFAIVAQADGAEPVVVNALPNVPIPINADRNLLTGVAGIDVYVLLKTEVLPQPHLVFEIVRAGSLSVSPGLPLGLDLNAHLVIDTPLIKNPEDLTVLAVFPFEAFNSELLPGAPNLFLGYQTRAAGDQTGGVAPAIEQIIFTPQLFKDGVLSSLLGADHTFELEINTIAAKNPVRLLAGHFDDINRQIINATGISTYLESASGKVPEHINLTLDVSESPLAGASPTASRFDIQWTASEPTLLKFDYFEDETFPNAIHDFNTTLTIDRMPTSEHLTLDLDEANGTLSVSHRANAVIGKIELRHTRDDGLTIIGTATDIPTEMDVTVDLAGKLTLDVNANTLDLQLQAIQEGGFLDTSDFLGYDLGYVSAKVSDVPDLTVEFSEVDKVVRVKATNPGESIGSVELLIDDDAHFNAAGNLVGLELPPSYNDVPPHHLFSVVDDGQHGTVVARLVHVAEAMLDLDADASQAFDLVLAEPAPMQAYLRTKTGSQLIPGHDVEITADIDDVPSGRWTWTFDGPTDFGYTTDPPQGIELIHVFGHFDNLNFDVELGNLPKVFDFEFDPNGSVAVKAEDGTGPNTDVIGHIAVRLWDETGPGLLPEGAPNILGVNLREARLRVDQIPSFHATWADSAAGTTVDFNTDAPDAFLGGAQFAVSTKVDLPPLPIASPDAHHYARFADQGQDGGGNDLGKQLAAGVFGIDQVTYSSDDTAGTLSFHYDANQAHVLDVSVDTTFGGLFFPGADISAALSVDDVPQTWDFVTDLKTQFAYEASAPITAITLTGTADLTNDGLDNGADIDFALLGLPSQVRVGLITDVVRVIDGRLDVNADGAVNGSDDGLLAGVAVIDGRLDLTGNGVVTGADDGAFFGTAVIDGGLDADGSSAVDGSDDGSVAGAEMLANGELNLLAASLDSRDDNFGIFGSDYRLLFASVSNVPEHLLLSYGEGRLLFETAAPDAGDTFDDLPVVTALVSTSSSQAANDAKINPFSLEGPVQSGPILGDPAIVGADGPGGSRIDYSPFLQEIDRRFFNEGIGGISGVFSRLALLYADGERLNAGEDHALVRKEDADNDGAEDDIGFASFQFTGLQHVSWAPDANGGRFVFKAPLRGDRPLFGGFEEADVFTTVQIEHIPDQIVVDFDKTEHIIYDASASAGEIDFYRGPLPMAGDDDSATRAIMTDTPTQVRIFWSFDFPDGGAFMDASNPFDLLFLTQDGDFRATAGVRLEDLHLGWGIDLFSFDVTKEIDLVFGSIPVAWELFRAKAGIDNDADGLTLSDLTNFNPSSINGNSAKQDVAGFFSLYELIDNPFDLTGASSTGGALPAPSGGEYVPRVSAMLEGFEEFSIDFLVELDPTNPGADLWPIDLEFDINTSKVGNLIFDFWSTDDTSFTDDDDIPFIPEVGFVNPPDYTDNTPFHILPGLFEDFVGNGLKGLRNVRDLVFTFDGWHSFTNHFDPFAGTPPPFGGSDGGGGFDPGDALFEAAAVPSFAAALNIWEDAGVASSTIDAIASNVDIDAHAFSGNTLGDASGSSAGGTIRIDPDAGGFEWFIDDTPSDHGEFGGGPPPADLTAAGAPASGKVDMLTFFLHEIGHLLGLDHATAGVMQSLLPRGVRRLPVAADLSADPPGDPAPDGPDDGALRVWEAGALPAAGPRRGAIKAATPARPPLRPRPSASAAGRPLAAYAGRIFGLTPLLPQARGDARPPAGVLAGAPWTGGTGPAALFNGSSARRDDLDWLGRA